MQTTLSVNYQEMHTFKLRDPILTTCVMPLDHLLGGRGVIVPLLAVDDHTQMFDGDSSSIL
jgi:hypothetical protein